MCYNCLCNNPHHRCNAVERTAVCRRCEHRSAGCKVIADGAEVYSWDWASSLHPGRAISDVPAECFDVNDPNTSSRLTRSCDTAAESKLRQHDKSMDTPQESNTERAAVDHQRLVRGGCVTESIFDGTSIVPLADVQHIEKRGDGNIMVIMKSTTYAFEQDEWMNPVYFAKGEAQRFLAAWCGYRAELEASTLADLSPANRKRGGTA